MAVRDRTGERYGRLVAIAPAEADARGRVMWICLCDCGNTVTVRGSSLGANTRSCGCLFMERAHQLGRTRKQGPIKYSGAHRRVRTERGPARKYPCVDCEGVAVDWSYNKTDPEELTEVMVLQGGYVIEVPYSLDPAHYSPRCRACHARFDRSERATA